MTKRLAFMLAASLGLGGLGACAGSATGTTYGGSGAGYVSVTVRSPELVTIEEDVYVLADADEPVFYADDNYWLYRENRWYRSRSYDRDWVYVESPSPRVRRIREPTAYVRYRSRHQEARTAPRPAPSDPWREEYDRTDAPSRPPPREQQPLQPVQPQQPAQPYPRPPQQEPVRPTDQAPYTPVRPPGHDVRPGHDRPAPGQDRAKPQPPAGGTHTTPPGPPANHDVRTPDHDRSRNNTKAREDHPPKSPPPARADEKRDERDARDDKRKQEKEDKKDQKRGH